MIVNHLHPIAQGGVGVFSRGQRHLKIIKNRHLFLNEALVGKLPGLIFFALGAFAKVFEIRLQSQQAFTKIADLCPRFIHGARAGGRFLVRLLSRLLGKALFQRGHFRAGISLFLFFVFAHVPELHPD